MKYKANNKRYSLMQYRYCGSSGLKLPLLSIGLWHNFGGNSMSAESKKILFKSFDYGITHFDLANNYGPPYGSAESNFGKIIKSDLESIEMSSLYLQKQDMICGMAHMENGDQKTCYRKL